MCSGSVRMREVIGRYRLTGLLDSLAGHPHGELWFEYFNEARAAGYVTPRDIELSLVRSYVRLDLLEGNDPKPAPPQAKQSRLRRLARPVKKALKGLVSNTDAA